MAEGIANTEDKSRTSDTQTVARLLDYKSAAAYMSLSYWSLREMVLDGQVGHVKYGKKVLLDRQDLDYWIEEHKEWGV